MVSLAKVAQSPSAQTGAAKGGAAVAFTPAHASAALQWLHKMSGADSWNLSVDEQAELLGGVPKRTYHEWKRRALAGEPVELSRDTLERLSLLLGIAKALQIIAPAERQELAYRWFTSPNQNPLFQGLSPKDYAITRGTMDALYTVRRYYDAARG
uniref:antitoxin Xre-like helix-turn-helix domain-containing protein n=1 Tax=Cellvibrio fontiphilus TaxID=1815559 RepID=UPI002B4BF5AC|nr:antitoxin Xre-like helix-turn-helix domain-containing protein [Cellvibrio fontiphilus]